MAGNRTADIARQGMRRDEENVLRGVARLRSGGGGLHRHGRVSQNCHREAHRAALLSVRLDVAIVGRCGDSETLWREVALSDRQRLDRGVSGIRVNGLGRGLSAAADAAGACDRMHSKSGADGCAR